MIGAVGVDGPHALGVAEVAVDVFPAHVEDAAVGAEVDGVGMLVGGSELDDLADGPHHIGVAQGQPVLRGLSLYHGKRGQGTFTFLGGHDPEDYQHRVGDPPTVLDLYPTSPGYRLILNNVLFPAARKKPQKT